jgi:tagaturonate epimerase
MKLNKYSFGVGDRFAHQAKAQLEAIVNAKLAGVSITPVWNKSHREHQIIGSQPDAMQKHVDLAVKSLGWHDPYFLDADHINLSNVDFFIKSCDFFTIDVADYIGKKAEPALVDAFVKFCKKFVGKIMLPVIETQIEIDESMIKNVAEKYLFAAQEAGRIYRYIEQKTACHFFVAEVSMDETNEPQSPEELFLILAALAKENVPLQTIAPKFSGRFNKGVDYVGSLKKFEAEFEQDLAVIQVAVKEFGLPENLKLSIHSGSDKFSIYPIVRQAIQKFDTGLHIKTAGTTWLEELIGLAEAGGEGLEIAKNVYKESLNRYDELCKPYVTVIDIDKEKLPTHEEVDKWDGVKFSQTLRHDQSNPNYNLHFRQLLHVGYKIAAQMEGGYLNALEENEVFIARNVTENLFERHIRPIFL